MDALIHRAVDQTVEPMNFIVRPIAADRLRGKNQLVQRIQITVTGQDIRVSFDGKGSNDRERQRLRATCAFSVWMAREA